MSRLWYPEAQKMDQGTTGGTMIGGQPHATLHDTETRSWAGKAYYHIEFMEVTPGQVASRQYRPFDRAARGLRNLAGGVQTNRQGSVHIQPSVVGYAKDAPHAGAWTPAMYQALNDFAVWCEAEWGIPLTGPPKSKAGRGNCFGVNSPCRFTHAEWKAYKGWSAHANAPENDHWDAPVDWDAILAGPGAPIELPGDDEEMALKLGDKGNAVAKFQKALLAWRPTSLPNFGADADFGQETEDAVKAYQRAANLTQTGQIDGVTASLLMEYVVDAADPVSTPGNATQEWVRAQEYAAKGTYEITIG